MFALLGGALLVALRVTPSLLLVPVFGGLLLRPLVRFALALALALALGGGALAFPRHVPADGWFVVLAGRELTLGVAMALVLSAPFFAVRYAGEMLDPRARPSVVRRGRPAGARRAPHDAAAGHHRRGLRGRGGAPRGAARARGDVAVVSPRRVAARLVAPRGARGAGRAVGRAVAGVGAVAVGLGRCSR